MPESPIKKLERLASSGDLASARTVVDAGKSVHPDEQWRLAQILETIPGRVEDAEAVYRRAACAGSTDALVDLTLLLNDAGRADEAERALRKLDATREAQIRIIRGRHYRATNADEQALREYERAAKLGSREGVRYLAGTFSHLGRRAEAEALYRDPSRESDPMLRLDFADHLSDEGEWSEAEEILRGLVRDHAPVAAQRALADFLSRDADSDEAIAHYVAAISRGDALAWTNLGVTWLEQDRLPEAELALRVGWRTRDPLAGRSLGKVFERTGRIDQALKTWNKTAALGDDRSKQRAKELRDRKTSSLPEAKGHSAARAEWREVAAVLYAIAQWPESAAVDPRALAIAQGAQIVHLLALPPENTSLQKHLEISLVPGRSSTRRASSLLLKWWSARGKLRERRGS